MEEDAVFGGGRILMLPWLALGHTIPYVELARRLCDKGFTVYLCSTKNNLNDSIKTSSISLQHKPYSEIFQTVEIHLPLIPGLPSRHDSTSSLPSHLMPLLKEAMNACKTEIAIILRTLKPDVFIHDCILPWAPQLASELGNHAVGFTPVNAAFYIIFFNLLKGINVDNNHAKYSLSSLKNHGFHSRKEMEELNGACCTVQFNEKKIRQERELVLLKTARFLEPGLIDYASELTGKKIIPLGTLVPYESQNNNFSDQLSQNHLADWMATKRSSSVVFASFGSEYFMSKEQITEIAFGLELSDQSFIWVIRLEPEKEEEEDAGKKIEGILPVGFLERVEDKGIVIGGWAPQMAILSHPSTGGSLTHCGWGSVCEGMACGVPFITLPQKIDQPSNSKLVTVELGLGVEIEREEDGGFKREKVAEAINRVMVEGEEREEIMKRAEEMAGKMREGEGEEGIDELVEEIENLR